MKLQNKGIRKTQDSKERLCVWRGIRRLGSGRVLYPPPQGAQGAALLVMVRAELGAGYMQVCFIIRLHNSYIYIYISV